jgi:hypothetical protein
LQIAQSEVRCAQRLAQALVAACVVGELLEIVECGLDQLSAGIRGAGEPLDAAVNIKQRAVGQFDHL